MDIRVGGPPQVGRPGESVARRPDQIEARLLAVRTPRRRSTRPVAQGPERRGPASGRDPAGGRVLVLMIPDARQLPPGLDSGEYRVFLRFARR